MSCPAESTKFGLNMISIIAICVCSFSVYVTSSRKNSNFFSTFKVINKPVLLIRILRAPKKRKIL